MTATGLMPLLAQQLVEQGSPPAQQRRPLPPPHQQQTAQSLRGPPLSFTSMRSAQQSSKKGSAGTPDKEKREFVFSWTDEMLAQKYQFLEEVGFGNWGSVWKVIPKDQSDRVQSVKLVHRSAQPTSAARLRALWTEFKCVRAFADDPHPNLIRFYSFILSPSYALCVMDFHRRLMPVSLAESHARPYLLQLLSAVAHLHKHGISHNDIKASNILLSNEDRPILIDFGFAQQYEVGHPEAFLSSLSWGTPEYLSPERAKGAVHDERLSDVFALGVTMYEIVVGRTPFEETEDETFLNRDALVEYYKRTLTGRFWGKSDLSTSFTHLISKMISPEPGQRMASCAIASGHPFFMIRKEPVVRSSTSESPSIAPPARTSPAQAQGQRDEASERMHGATRMLGSEGCKKAAFVIYEDADQGDAPAAVPASTFAPKPLALVERTNQTLKLTVTGETAPLTKTARAPPGPSRIPIRTMKERLSGPSRADASQPFDIPKRVPSHHRVVSTPLALANGNPVRPRVTSQPLLQSRSSTEDSEAPNSKRRALSRTFSSTRKPPPALTHERNVLTTSGIAVVTPEEGGYGPRLANTTEMLIDTTTPPTITRSRTCTVTPDSKGSGSQSVDGVSSRDFPKLNKKSPRSLSNSLKKLSTKHVRRAPSVLSLGSSIFGSRRRVSSSNTTFEIVEAERVMDRTAHTLPLDLRLTPQKQPEIAQARLVNLSQRSQDITPPRQTDPFLISASAAVPRTPPFRPGHRRIPTAIRNTPTVILHESTDDGDCSESDYSRTGTAVFDARLVSPPPPPRVVAEAQRLPTWVPDSDSDDASGEGDVDEPTITLSSSPAHSRKTASRAFPGFTQQAQRDEREQPAVRPAQDASLRGLPRPTSTFSTSPFTNLHVRNNSASIFDEDDVPNKLNESTGRDSSGGLHKRSRSVVSFFSLFGPSPSLSTSSTSAIDPWAPDGTVRKEAKEGKVAFATGSALDRLPEKHDKDKKAGRLRKVFGRLFR
ncbi:hypothetical protein B0A53_03127 [Rhodotorula sp. CCFEE 5036]|nr:hypothetical protein B0A53_03127 [Rhodotorula sp. CCFEE 5036]